jgi:predicted SnoaL-like aldol condensation-catalyzing enzyme
VVAFTHVTEPKEHVMIKAAFALVAAFLFATPSALADAKLEANKKDFDAASRYFGPHYIQHNPGAADGIEGFKQFLAFLRDKFPNYKSEIKRVIAEGDYVMLHVHNIREPGTRGRAIIDIFRLENGKIVEHWDVAQDIPEKMPHNNGMF